MKVSCIMPTRNRGHLLPLALACFDAQDWPERELVVLDDGEEPVDKAVGGHPGVLYGRLPAITALGKKRNLCCEMARGDVIVHWDDDDWSAPTRIRDQVSRLVSAGKSVSGYHSLFFWSMTLGRAFKYQGQPSYSCGTALCYTRDYWARNRFKDWLPVKGSHEDNDFTSRARDHRELVSAAGWSQLVVRAHCGTTSADSRIGSNGWPAADASELPAKFFEDLSRAL